MTEAALDSTAFYHATLKSESYRIIGLICLLGGLVTFVLARSLMMGVARLAVAQLIVLTLVITHEALMLRAIKTALQSGAEVRSEKWMLNVLVESQIPTIALFLLLATEWFTPDQVLVAPAVLLYFILIILSTLRLSPSLTLLTSLLSALGYLFTTFYTGSRFPDSIASPKAFPLAVYFIYAASIFSGGILASIVAYRIRQHVTMALREAKLQNMLDQVHHELDIARSIQQGLLPTESPNLENFDLVGWNRPADQTGGDYFDWQSLPDGRLAISLGDATGHGIGPALISMLCRAYARANLIAGDAHHRMIERLNRLLVEDLSANRFVTFALLLLNPNNCEVEILSAGHGPILWYRHATDEIENLEAQGIPLGMLAEACYEKAQVKQLAPGDMLVLITDGFYEWENPAGQEFGLQRLKSLIHASHSDTVQEVIRRLLASVESFSEGTEQKDDLTAIVLKRKPAR